jgi:hypothetical protein
MQPRLISPTEPGSRQALRLFLGLAVVAAVLFAAGGDAVAVQVPTTLADRRPAQTGAVEPGFPIDYLALVWDTADGPESSPRSGPAGEPYGAVRFRHDGVWGTWIPLTADDLQSPGQWGSALLPAGDAEAYQVRGVPAGAGSPRVVVINTTDGPLLIVGERPAGATALTNCRSRAEWGAEESLRFIGEVESWPPTFEPVRVMTVHHTATANNDDDPAATVRAIYYYHTVDRGWGDIAYHYLIDEAGVVYEGRWSGEESAACSDFAYSPQLGPDDEPLLVTAGHTYCYNRGNVGVALLGDFTSVQPTSAARAALESVLVENAIRNGLDPLGTVFYEAPNDMDACVDTPDATVESIAAHTDWPDPAGATACPGAAFYPQMPSVRAEVAAAMGIPVPAVEVGSVEYETAVSRRIVKTLSVTITLDPPLAGATVSAAISGPSSAASTAVTDGSGSIVITIRKPKAGCYTTEVSTVAVGGWVWDGLTPANEYCF